MPVTDDLITVVPGDDLSVERPVTNIPTGDSLAESWFAVKESPRWDDDTEALIGPKHISTLNNVGVGQITDDGAGDEVGEVRFDLSYSETVLLDPTKTYYTQIKHLTTNGFRYTSHLGTIRALGRQVVRT